MTMIMILVNRNIHCAGGLSHNEAEYTSPEQCAAGAQVLLNAVLEFDRRLG